MKREVKFRAWDTKLEEMIKDPYIEQHMQFAHLNELISAALTRYILMQYTGLKDKNGKEIYEGDIIEHWDNRYIVPPFTPIDRSYEAENVLPHHDGSDDWMSMSNVDWEVIGNIYENPELLAKGEDKDID